MKILLAIWYCGMAIGCIGWMIVITVVMQLAHPLVQLTLMPFIIGTAIVGVFYFVRKLVLMFELWKL